MDPRCLTTSRLVFIVFHADDEVEIPTESIGNGRRCGRGGRRPGRPQAISPSRWRCRSARVQGVLYLDIWLSRWLVVVGVFPKVVVVRPDGWNGGVITIILVGNMPGVSSTCSVECPVELVEAGPLVLPIEVIQFLLFVDGVIRGVVEGTVAGSHLGGRHHTKDEGAVGPREPSVVVWRVFISDASTK